MAAVVPIPRAAKVCQSMLLEGPPGVSAPRTHPPINFVRFGTRHVEREPDTVANQAVGAGRCTRSDAPVYTFVRDRPYDNMPLPVGICETGRLRVPRPVPASSSLSSYCFDGQSQSRASTHARLIVPLPRSLIHTAHHFSRTHTFPPFDNMRASRRRYVSIPCVGPPIRCDTWPCHNYTDTPNPWHELCALHRGDEACVVVDKQWAAEAIQATRILDALVDADESDQTSVDALPVHDVNKYAQAMLNIINPRDARYVDYAAQSPPYQEEPITLRDLEDGALPRVAYVGMLAYPSFPHVTRIIYSSDSGSTSHGLWVMLRRDYEGTPVFTFVQPSRCTVWPCCNFATFRMHDRAHCGIHRYNRACLRVDSQWFDAAKTAMDTIHAHLSYRPGGRGYQIARDEFERRSATCAKPAPE